MPPTAEVFRDVAVPMRDGTVLRADVYLPRERPRPLRALVTRTPYNKNGPLTAASDYGRLAALGYAVVVEDKRGRYASEGEFTLLRDDSDGPNKDGYDTVEWIAAQPWCDGWVGAFGLSYLGHTTMGAAIAAPPHLRAGVSLQPSSDEFTDRTFVDGVLNLENNVNWATSEMTAGSLIARAPEELRAELTAEVELHRSRGESRFDQLPLLDWPFLRRFEMLWTGSLAHREDPEYFSENQVTAAEAARVTVPIEHVGGWFDPFCRNSVRHFELLAAHSPAGDRQRLVMGPWMHGGLALDANTGVTFPGAATDQNALVAEWMARCASAEPERGGPAAYLYVIGANRWRAEPAWPIPGTVTRSLHLDETGALGEEVPRAGSRRFRYDPAAPYRAPGITAGMLDCREHQGGDNVLVFETAPVTEPWEITGWPRAHLHVALSSTDADLLVELHLVGTDGVARLVNEGITRARYRDGRTSPAPVEPGAVVEYTVELRPISIELQPGEALRCVVSGGKFPSYERNPNAFVDLNSATEADFVIAQYTLHTGGAHPSRLELPTVPPGARGSWVDNPWPASARDATPTSERAATELG